MWLALLTAPYVGGGIVEIIRGLTDAMGSPFAVTVCEDSVKTVLVFLAAYGMAIGIYFSTRRNYRRREEDVYKRQRKNCPKKMIVRTVRTSAPCAENVCMRTSAKNDMSYQALNLANQIRLLGGCP